MKNVILILILLSGLSFVIAVFSPTTGAGFMGIASEGFSRASSNLALIAIALLLFLEKKVSSS